MISDKIKKIFLEARKEALKQKVQANFSYHSEKSHLMRIGNNSVSLNTSEDLTRLDIKVTIGKKQGTHTQMGEISTEKYVLDALKITIEKAKNSLDLDFTPLKEVVEENFVQKDQYDKKLENLDPAFKMEGYKRIIETIGQQYNYSGSWSSGSTEHFIMTTENENSAYHLVTDQNFSLVIKHPEKKWELISTQTGWKKSDFKVAKTIKEFQKLLPVYENHKGFKVKPGKYTVVLGSAAVAEVMEMALWTGFYGRIYEEKRGWTSKNKTGDNILGKNINLTDDPANPDTFMFSFDMSGKKRKKFVLCKEGKLQNIMYDPQTAAMYKKKPTGHNIGGSSIGVGIGKGDKSLLKAVKELGTILYIPALHYINLPNPSKGIFTGSSRFNAVLIKNGKIVSPIFSSRITDNFQSVFGNVKLISSESVSFNGSNTYGRRSPVAMSVPSYMVCEKVKITDCADSF
jgi:predicted Zn-dependent protease